MCLRTVLAAMERGVGIFGIKVFGNAFLLRTYRVSDCLRYTWRLPGVTATPLGFTTVGQLEDDVRIAQSFKPLSAEERQALAARATTGKLDSERGLPFGHLPRW